MQGIDAGAYQSDCKDDECGYKQNTGILNQVEEGCRWVGNGPLPSDDGPEDAHHEYQREDEGRSEPCPLGQGLVGLRRPRPLPVPLGEHLSSGDSDDQSQARIERFHVRHRPDAPGVFGVVCPSIINQPPDVSAEKNEQEDHHEEHDGPRLDSVGR